jgi:hypothetical protein
LLGFVPLVSGSGSAVLAVLFEEDARLFPLICFVALVGSLVTLGLFRWELCNIQTCFWLIKGGSQIENKVLDKKLLDKNSFGHFYGRWGLPPPKIFGLAVGKTEAEKLIYGVSIFAWLVVPLAAVIPATAACSVGLIYVVLAILVVCAVVISCCSPVGKEADKKPKGDAHKQ